MNHGLFVQLAATITVVVILSLVIRRLRQPPIIGYILAGIVVSPYGLGIVQPGIGLEIFSELGVSLLLFMVGLSLSPSVLRDVGRVAVLAGTGQIVTTTTLGFVLSRFLGFSTVVSLYLGVGLTFSSTIIVLKLLSDKGQLSTLSGRMATGILIVQDIVAMLLLIVLPTILGHDHLSQSLLLLGLRGGGLALVLIPFGLFVLPHILRLAAGSQELLLLFSLAWSMAVAAFCEYVGLSIEIGALLAGVLLSLSPYRIEVAAKLRPLRDFFLVIFFVLLGSQMTFDSLATFLWPILAFSLFVLIGNPLILFLWMSVMGYGKRPSLCIGLTMAQISEFSFILGTVGVRLGHLPPSIVSLLTFVGMITIAASTYFILYDETIVRLCDWPLSFLCRRKNCRSMPIEKSITADILLIGHDRVGRHALQCLLSDGHRPYVVDFDPAAIRRLADQGIACEYGDIANPEFLKDLPLAAYRMVLSTIRSFEATSLLLREIRAQNQQAVIVVLSESTQDALALYELGATYVITPHTLSGHHVSSLVKEYGFDQEKFSSARERHVHDLRI